MASQALLEAAERTKADEDNEAIAVRRRDRRRTAAKSGDMAVADVCRQMRISEAIFHVWKKKYAYLGSTDIGELRQLCEEKRS